MPAYPTDYAAFSTSNTFVDDVGGAGGTPLDAAHLNPLRSEVAAYVQHHILGDLTNNQHSTGQIYELSQQTNSENLAYAAVAATEYTQFQINSMLRLLMRYIIGGVSNGATLSSMITTWLARSDANNVNLFSLGNLIAGATDIDTLGAIVLRNATTGLINARAIALSIPVGNANPAALLFKRVASQTLPFTQWTDESNVLLAQVDKGGGSLFTSQQIFSTLASAVASEVRGAASQSADIARVADSTGATKYWRVTSGGNVVGLNGFWTGATGSEKQVIDASGNFIATLLSPRQFNEFPVTLSASALTGTVGVGKYVDSVGAPITFPSTVFTVTTDATKWVWWALTLPSGGGSVHAVANTAGGNTVAGSAIKANFAASEWKIGYVLVPPSPATNLSTATFDDWRGTNGPDGNTGAAGAGATATYITSADESTPLTNSLQLSKVLMGGVGVISPTGSGLGNNGGPYLLRSSYTSSADYDASLQNRLAADWSPSLASQIAMSSNTMSIAGITAAPAWISITGRWRVSLATITTTNTASGAGVKYLIADLSGTGPGFTCSLSTTNSASAYQKVIAAAYYDGSAWQGSIDLSYLDKKTYAQYTPSHVLVQATASALGANIAAGLTGGPVATIYVPSACWVDLDWELHLTSTAVGWYQFVLTQQINSSGSYSTVTGPYWDFETIVATAQHYTIGRRYTGQLTAGRNDFRIGAGFVSGTGPTPTAATIQGWVYGA